jgi:hypothetical protein
LQIIVQNLRKSAKLAPLRLPSSNFHKADKSSLIRAEQRQNKLLGYLNKYFQLPIIGHITKNLTNLEMMTTAGWSMTKALMPLLRILLEAMMITKLAQVEKLTMTGDLHWVGGSSKDRQK